MAMVGSFASKRTAWRDADRQTLYLAAQTGFYRIRLNNPGAIAFARGL
jgi:hypothetical protein